MNVHAARVDAWLVERESAGWFTDLPWERQSVRAQWRESTAMHGAESPPAKGCLLALVRLAHNCPTLQCGNVGGWGDDWDTWLVGNPPGRGHGCVIAGEGPTEIDALVAALEASP